MVIGAWRKEVKKKSKDMLINNKNEEWIMKSSLRKYEGNGKRRKIRKKKEILLEERLEVEQAACITPLHHAWILIKYVLGKTFLSTG